MSHPSRTGQVHSAVIRQSEEVFGKAGINSIQLLSKTFGNGQMVYINPVRSP